MVLSVLSGEKPVTEAIEKARISRGTYYQMETRALRAMLAALNPLAASRQDGSADLSAAAAARIAQLEGRVKGLEQEKRRADRLLLLTRKAMRLVPMALPRGRPPKKALPYLTRSAKPRSKGSKAKAKAMASPSSTPTTAGESAPSGGFVRAGARSLLPAAGGWFPPAPGASRCRGVAASALLPVPGARSASPVDRPASDPCSA